MNKKGFTLIELIGVIVLLSLLTSIATVAVNNYLKQGRERTFKILTNSVKDATLDAYSTCLVGSTTNTFCNTHTLGPVGEWRRLYLSELIDEGFIEDVKNPWKTSEKCSSDSYVDVTREDTENFSLEYRVCLICGSHESEGCSQGNVTN